MCPATDPLREARIVMIDMESLAVPTLKPMLGLLLAQSRVLEAVATGAVLEGTPAELINRLQIGPEMFRPALHDLVEGGWVFAITAQDGTLRVGRERRRRESEAPGRIERRMPASLWEGADARFAW
jgi:hypothetical protein